MNNTQKFFSPERQDEALNNSKQACIQKHTTGVLNYAADQIVNSEFCLFKIPVI